MSFLVVDVGGPNELTLACQQGGHAEPRRLGGRRYGFLGNERSMIRAEYHTVPVVLTNIPAATIATVRDLFADGATVDCQGDVFNNAGAVVPCLGVLTEEMEVGGPYWTGTLTLSEVGA